MQARLRQEAERRIRKVRDCEAQLVQRVEAAKAAEESGLHEVAQKVRGAAVGARLFAAKGFDHLQDPSEKVNSELRHLNVAAGPERFYTFPGKEEVL